MNNKKIYMPRKKRKINKLGRLILSLLLLLIVLIIVVVNLVKNNKYRSTDEYKLKSIGYNTDEINIILDSSTKNSLNKILDLEYNKSIPNILKEEYYLEKNLTEYIEYSNKFTDKSIKDVIAIINVNSDNKWYSNTQETDINKGILMLCNKFNQLTSSYEPDDLENVKNWYSYGDSPQLKKEAYQAFISMFNDAKKEDLSLIINSSYRTFEYQQELYDDYLNAYGLAYTDSVAARPGFSEHQTGLAIDIMTYGATAETFETYPEFTWLQENAYKYGYILRYPKEKEYLTGYAYESWHYRYVGVEVAEYIHQHNITFDEYYAYFIEK